MTDKQIIINGVDVSGCEFCVIDAIKGNSELCCKILQAHGDFNIGCYKMPDCYYKHYKRKEEEYNALALIIRNTEEYKNMCSECADDILIYPTISGRTEYSQIEVETGTLLRIISKLKHKTQECKLLKAALKDKNIIALVEENERLKQKKQDDETFYLKNTQTRTVSALNYSIRLTS